MTMRQRSGRAELVLGLLLGLFVAGCGGSGGKLPPTYKVTGTVTSKAGQSVKGGAIQFTHEGDTPYAVFGEIQEDGSFTLYTVKGSERVAGAPEGEYMVTIGLPIPADQKGKSSIVLPKTFRVEPKDNTFVIEIPSSAGRP
jgi:hypothetical protein